MRKLNYIIETEAGIELSDQDLFGTSIANAGDLDNNGVNDILVDGCKLSGILLEGYKGFLILGIGCNIADFDNMDKLNATSLQTVGIGITNIELIEKLTIKLAENIQHYRDYGFSRFKNYWLEHAYKLGDVINVNFKDRKQTGVFKTINDDGKLVLEIDGNCHSISAGELFDL